MDLPDKKECQDYCAFCENDEMLREFKGIYICESCIDDVKKNQFVYENDE